MILGRFLRLRVMAVALLAEPHMAQDNDRIDVLRGTIIGCAIEVHRRLGPGLLESIYKSSMAIELKLAGLAFIVNPVLPVTYRGHIVGANLVADIIVEDLILLELKSVSSLAPVHTAQVLTYLRLSGRPAGLLLNFNSFTMKQGIRRVTHPDVYVRPASRTPEKRSNPA